jgi:dethiobiotin synthetase
MVPLNDKELIIDLIKKLDVEVILVIQHYLGSINHSLLSLMALKNYGISCKGIIYNGGENESSETAIFNYAQTPVLGHVPNLKTVDKQAITNIQLDL